MIYMPEGIRNSETHVNEVDFIVTHCCATSTIERYNVFRAVLLVRHAEDNRLHLYDIMKIKKETSTHFQSEDLTQ